MKEINGNLFDYSVIVIPTNGIVKTDNRLVMGAGVALEAKNKFKDLDLVFGEKVSKFGNIVFVTDYNFDTILFSFPTKHHYKNDSDLTLIEISAKQLVDKVNKMKLTEVYLPKIGCGYGNLSWSEVKPVLEKYLDDRFIIVSN